MVFAEETVSITPRTSPRHERRTMNQSDSLVVALYHLESARPGPHAVPELVVAAFRANVKMWRMNLPAGQDFPCSNRCIAALSHKNGPIKAGYIIKPVPGVAEVQLTEAGKAWAGILLGDD